MQALFSQPSITVGDAVLAAKSGIADSDVRKTFILFGDPLLRLKVAMVEGNPSGITPLLQAPDRSSLHGRSGSLRSEACNHATEANSTCSDVMHGTGG